RTRGVRALREASSGPPTSPTSNRGKFVMDQARRLVADMEVDERRLLSGRIAVEDARTRFVMVLAGAGSLLAAILALVINSRLNAFAGVLERQNEALLGTNEDLARTADQLGELTFLLNEAEASTHL